MKKQCLPYLAPLAQVVLLQTERATLQTGSPTGETYDPPVDYDGFIMELTW